MVLDEEDKTASSWLCEKNSAGTYTCVEIKPAQETSIPPGLSEAIGKALGDVKPDASIGEGANNEPKVPKEPAFDNGLTTSPGTQNETKDPNEPAFNDGLTTSPGTR